MANTYKIRVTRRDIRAGEPECETRCPIAKAIRRTLKNKKHVAVLHNRKIAIGNKLAYLEESASDRWITRFDMGKVVNPATFTLCIT